MIGTNKYRKKPLFEKISSIWIISAPKHTGKQELW
jgi:hypothetical protein